MLNTKINNIYIFYTINNLSPMYVCFLTLTYVIHGLHIWFSYYRIQLHQPLKYIFFPTSSQIMGLEICTLLLLVTSYFGTSLSSIHERMGPHLLPHGLQRQDLHLMGRT